MKKDAIYGFQDDEAEKLPPITFYSSIENLELDKDYSLNYLAASYIKIKKPLTLNENTSIQILFNGISDSDWGVKSVKVMNDSVSTKMPDEMLIDPLSYKGSVIYNNFGGTASTDIKEIVLITSRLKSSSSNTLHKFNTSDDFTVSA